MSSHQWMRFWPQDWRGEPSLRICSLAARGLWIELLCLAHEGRPYGHVTILGRRPTVTELSAMTGAVPSEIDRLLSELRNAGVFGVTRGGVMYSRRMVKDQKRSEAARLSVSQRRDRGEIGERSGRDVVTPFLEVVDTIDGNPERNTKALRQEAEAESEVEEKEKNPVGFSKKKIAQGQFPAVVDGPDPAVLAQPTVKFAPNEAFIAFELYQTVARCLGLSLARSCTPDRQHLIQTRLDDMGGLSVWRDGMAMLQKSQFIISGGYPGFGLHSMLQSETFAKVLDGAYLTRLATDRRSQAADSLQAEIGSFNDQVDDYMGKMEGKR